MNSNEPQTSQSPQLDRRPDPADQHTPSSTPSGEASATETSAPDTSSSPELTSPELTSPEPTSPEPGTWSVEAGCRLIKDLVAEHLFVILAGGVALLVLLQVQQVANVVWRLPPPDPWYHPVEYLLFLVVVLWYFASAPWGVLPWDWSSSKRIGKVLTAPSRWAAGWLESPLRGLKPARLAGVGVIFFCVGLVAIGTGPQPMQGDSYLLAGAFCRGMGYLCVTLGFWAIAPALWQRLRQEDLRENLGWRVVGRTATWWASSTLIAEVLWVGAEWTSHLDYRIYTVWTAVSLLSALLVLASSLDYLYRHTLVPVRTLTVVVLVLAMTLEAPDRIGKESPPEFDQTKQTPGMVTYLKKRLKTMPEDQPVVIVAASGGGSRAAIFTMLAYEALARTPMRLKSADLSTEDLSTEDLSTEDLSTEDLGPSPGDSDSLGPEDDQPPESSGVEGRPVRSWGDQILLISSVSGGSLATAHFVARDCQPSANRPPRHLNLRELKRNMQKWAAESHSLRNARPLILRWLEAQKLAADETQPNAAVDLHLSWLAESAAVDDMSTNFLAPLIRGANYWSLSRGDALLAFWEDEFQWGDHGQAGGFGQDRYQHPQRRPAVIFNVADIDHPRRLMIGFPALERQLLSDGLADLSLPSTGSEDSEGPRVDRPLPGRPELPLELRVPRLQLPTSLSAQWEGGPGEISLARAVRLSSNFPWGFRVSQLHLGQKDSHAPKETINTLDAGLVDNTGIDSVYYLLRSIDRVAALGNPDAAEVISQLRRRGVVFLEIDADPSSEAEDDTWPTPLDWVTKPAGALYASLFTNAKANRKFYQQALLELIFPTPEAYRQAQELCTDLDPVKDEKLVRILNKPVRNSDWCVVALNPGGEAGASAEIMLSWALGPEGTARLRCAALRALWSWDHSIIRGLPRIDEVEDFRNPPEDFRSRFRRQLAELPVDLASLDEFVRAQRTTKAADQLLGLLARLDQPARRTPAPGTSATLAQCQESAARLQGRLLSLESLILQIEAGPGTAPSSQTALAKLAPIRQQLSRVQDAKGAQEAHRLFREAKAMLTKEVTPLKSQAQRQQTAAQKLQKASRNQVLKRWQRRLENEDRARAFMEQEAGASQQ